MAVTVSNIPIKLYLTNPATNTAHPVGGVLTEEQQAKIDEALQLVADALLKTSTETQTVTSNVEFNTPVKVVNSEGTEENPIAVTEAVSYGLLLSLLTPLQNQVEDIQTDLDAYPPALDIMTLSAEQTAIEKKHFDAGLTTTSYTDVVTATDNSVLNKADILKLIQAELDNGGLSVSTGIEFVNAFPDEDDVEKGHIYVLIDGTTA